MANFQAESLSNTVLFCAVTPFLPFPTPITPNLQEKSHAGQQPCGDGALRGINEKRGFVQHGHRGTANEGIWQMHE